MSAGEHADERIGRVLGGRFRVRQLIGRGGMGSVYEAEHTLTERVGALKLLHGRYAATEDVVRRFMLEASAAGRIDNPHVAATFDAGVLESGEPYIFMERLTGAPLSAWLRERGRLGFEEAREIVRQAALGLTGAHAAGIVHRDIKPENLFVCAGAGPFVKVLDFGISRFPREATDLPRLTAAGVPIGTPAYMSPEQVAGERDLDPRTDVYSLGVVLYECLTEQLPFQAESLAALGMRIADGHYVPASALVAELPVGLDAVIARALAGNLSQRYPDMSSFAAELSALGTVVAPAGFAGGTVPLAEWSKAGPATPPKRERASGFSGRSAWILLALALAGGGVGLALLAAPSSHPDATERKPPAIAAAKPVDTAPPSEAPSLPATATSVPSATSPEASASAPRAPNPRAPATGTAVRARTPRAAADGLTVENPF